MDTSMLALLKFNPLPLLDDDDEVYGELSEDDGKAMTPSRKGKMLHRRSSELEDSNGSPMNSLLGSMANLHSIL